MLKCECGYVGVNLIPNFQDNTAHCPWCNRTFPGVIAENAIKEDFSQTKVRDVLWRYGKNERYSAFFQATVTKVTETEIFFESEFDKEQKYSFNRQTGVDMLKRSGFISRQNM